jgi:hypothetical protein
LIGEAGIEPAFWRTHRPAPMGDVLARLSRRESEVKAAFQDPDGMPRIMPRGSEAFVQAGCRHYGHFFDHSRAIFHLMMYHICSR